MNIKIYIGSFLIAVLFYILSADVISAVPVGMVRDYNKMSGKVTVLTSTPGMFPPGSKLIIYHGYREVCKIQVVAVFHTNILGTIIKKGTHINKIGRTCLVVRSRRDLFRVRKPKKRFTRISFKEIASEAGGWIARVVYNRKICKKNSRQARKIYFSNTIGIKRKNIPFYTPIKIKDIRSLHYTWDGTLLVGSSIVLKNRKRILCDEILTPDVFTRIKPPRVCRSENQKVSIVLNRRTTYSKMRPDAQKVYFRVDKPLEALGTGDHYLLKVYSNHLFITEYVIHKEKMKDDRIRFKFYFPGYMLMPGKNKISFFIVEAKERANEYFESGEQRLIGKKEIFYSEKNNYHEFRIKGRGGKFPSLQ